MVIGGRIAVAVSLMLVASAGYSCTSEDRTAGPQVAGESSTTQPPSETTQPAPTASSEATTPTPAPTPASQPAPQAAQTGMSDEQILAVLDAANDKEIAEAKAIEGKTKNRDVKSFAKMMIEHHGDAKAKGQQLATTLGVTPADFDQSRELREDATKQADDLKSASARDVDRKYMDLMVEDHKAVLTMIDDKLLSDAKNSDLQSLIREIRPTVAAHLSAAEAIQAKLAGNSGPNAKTPKTTPSTGKQPGATERPKPNKNPTGDKSSS